jgi:hypothetical protein
MAEQSERDIIIESRALLQESIKSISNIRNELSNIYGKIESDARTNIKVGADVSSFKESTLEKISSLVKSICSLEDDVKEITKSVEEEAKIRAVFQGEILASFKTTKIISGVIATILTIIITLVAIFKE